MELVDRTPREIAAEFLEHGAQSLRPDLPDIAGMAPDRIAELPSLPYGDLAFSGRLLREQTDITTTDSSRPPSVVARQLAWLRGVMPDWRAGRVLHPLCGPGHYTAALREHGMTSYVGVDAGPAVVDHARRRFAGRDDTRFLLEDAADTTFLTADHDTYDTLLLTYDAANFFAPHALRELLGSLVRNLRRGGTAVLDLRLVEDGAAGFDEGRQVHRRRAGSVFRDGPHLLLSEGFVAAGGALLGHRIIAVGDGSGGGPPEVFHSVLHVPTAEQITAHLASAGLEVCVRGRPFAGSADPNLARHLVAARKPHTTHRPAPWRQP
ncbi:class I SAM-dependent methyltransferase [Streptomyces sp. NPDC054766]|uniref:class I SAM-dependent methyltransferase n=1 Tax=Streptomyces rhizosphaerihabitans TaxID=1266770 RepID=UPI0021C03E69|nr:class I SAM-dependent methyltransferase [Streptomyces rhizosphaerihabitans]MCT9007407.1 class I SAM-dependent methyltransferase [Streptomyces rhizosphaerihabitans]